MAKEGISTRCWNKFKAASVFARYSPFFVGLAAGTLDAESFSRCISQDAHFLNAFAGAYKLAADCAEDDITKGAIRNLRMSAFQQLQINDILIRSLKHQRKWKSDPNHTKSLCDRGATIFISQADKYRKGACENCGAMTHDAKSCTERPRKVGVKWTNKHIAPDEKVETFELDFDGKRDRWNGYDASTYARLVTERYEARDEARRKYLKQQQIKKLEEDDDDGLRVDEARVDESKQMDFAKVEKRVRTTGGGSTGTVRNFRIREDTAKYLVNLDANSAYYDPKSRSMREDPLPEADPNEKFYGGDNKYSNSGQAWEFKQLNIHACNAFEKGQDVHMQAAPSHAELLYKNYTVVKEKLESQTKLRILEKYGNAATEEEIPRQLLLGQTEKEVKYDRAGRIIEGQDMALPRSKYEEDIFINNHTSVWGSYWKDHQWGYKCCKQVIANSYCTGAAGIEAAEASIRFYESQGGL